MIRNDQIQQGIVSYLKANATITAQLTTSAEIREDQWQGRDFVYPNIRVRMISNLPQIDNRDGCDHRVSMGIQAYSEDDSSQEADRIAGIIGNVLHGRSFSSNSLNFHSVVTNLVPAVRSDIRTWRSEVLLQCIVSG